MTKDEKIQQLKEQLGKAQSEREHFKNCTVELGERFAKMENDLNWHKAALEEEQEISSCLKEQLAKAQAECDEQAKLAEEFRLKIPTTAEAMVYLGLLNKYKALQAQCAVMRDALGSSLTTLRLVRLEHGQEIQKAIRGPFNDITLSVCKSSKKVEQALSTDAGKELLETMERYRKALEFYADENTWLDQNFPHGDYLSPASVDAGKVARQSLNPNAK